MSTRRVLANAIRALSMDAVQQANSGHPGAPMGMADIAEVLWNDHMKHNPANPGADHLATFHNHLSLQAGAYQNSCWVVAVAKAGVEEGVEQIGGTCIVAPSGQIVAGATSLTDELVVARCDLDLARLYRESTFDFARHRRIEHYGLITERTDAAPPGE